MTSAIAVPPPELDSRVTFLSELLFNASRTDRPAEDPRLLCREDFDAALTLADSHHVTMRSMEIFQRAMLRVNDAERAQWAADALERESARIARALTFLRAICDALDSEGCAVVVIKSLDHYPDLGSDLDLYTNAEPARVIHTMRQRFRAEVAPRSWGDRLANKWNFLLPGLPEAVEIHIKRLGQTGEQVALARSLPAQARSVKVGDHWFRVPSVEHRVMISTLQRMYRHFYFRLCDLADTAKLMREKAISYEELRAAARTCGIWEGVATYLSVVSDWLRSYGELLEMPPWVSRSASFGAERVSFRRGFLRLPILPHSARLYRSELATLLWQGELVNTARLSLLPCLATAAVVGMKITGSDKGIW